MQRTAVNPWQWSLQFGFNQAESIEGHQRVLVCSGQASIDAEGAGQHAGDMAAQIGLALDNLETVLSEAGMGLADVVKLTMYTTDVDDFIANFGLLGERFGQAGAAYASTLIGVTRLAFPELMVELEAIAMQ